MDSRVKVRVPGTTANCGPGFDAVGIACAIYNELELRITNSKKLVIEVLGEGRDAIPTDEKNIAYQAAKAVFEKVGKTYQGMHIVMTNRIPLARGLGSSAAAIVAGLVAANEVADACLTKAELLNMATTMEGHPDNVAPAIYGGISVNVMREKQVDSLKFLPPKPLTLIVAVPAFSLSTKAARRVLPAQVPLPDAVFNVSRTALLVGALCTGELKHLSAALEDRLHQPYRQQLIPGMADVLEAAKKAGAFGATLSGAGPCLIAYADKNPDSIGQAMIQAFAKNDVTASYLVLSIDTEGAKTVS